MSRKSEAGKGDAPRPYSIPLEEFWRRWDKIFRKKQEKKDDRSAQ